MEWLSATALAGLVYHTLRRPLRLMAPVQDTLTLDDAGHFSLEVMGEPACTDTLQAIAGAARTPHYCEAQLGIEPAHDAPDTVTVRINGRKIGRLSCRHTGRFMHRISGTGHVRVRCPAVIIGGGRDRTHLGVWLDIAL